ncbi:hypothetical protein VHEMI04202 [[Torrubiella] hemipterigena]|uniref:Uncharacterized protein n=1 Tax=[Torrubiella] hemipterigena TaxID=1531966 RepID=A0A0A1TD65_9HYPO|nr:hypothetical protein VHEMI04202 [[Torrubiella] hemipterigena]
MQAMELFKSAPKPSTVIIYEWHHEPQPTQPARRFWTLDASKDESNGKIALTPAMLSRQSTESRESTAKSGTNIPPLLMYDAASHHVEAHTTTGENRIDTQVNRFGPGVRLSQTQTMNELFTGKPMATSDSGNVLLPAAVLPDPRQSHDDDTSSPHVLVAMAVGNGKDSMSLKYRLRQIQSHKKPLLRLQEAYSGHEQTVRLADDTETPSASPNKLVQLNLCSIGQSTEYLLLLTLSVADNSAPSLLSIYSVDEKLAFSEASSITEPNEDLGVRWQLQNFKLPAHVSKIAPVVLDTSTAKYLVIFYFNDGALRFTSLQYTGSGSFIGPVNDYPCKVGTAKERQPSAENPNTTVTSPSRFSLPSYIPFATAEQTPEQAKQQNRQAAYKQSKMVAGDGVQPYALKANRSIWIFYEGRDGQAKYVRHELPTDIAGLYDGWLAASWEVAPSSKKADDAVTKDKKTPAGEDFSVNSDGKLPKVEESSTRSEDASKANEDLSEKEADSSKDEAAKPKPNEESSKTEGEAAKDHENSSKNGERSSTDGIDHSIGRHFIPVEVAFDFLSMQ